MRSWKILAALAGAIGVMAPASGETLRVAGVYPAASDRAVTLESIAIQQFGGVDGPALSIKAGDALRSARIDGQPFFDVAPDSVMRDADGVLSGYVSTDVDYRRSGDKEVERCVRRDDKNKCVERRKERIPCEQMDLYVRPTLRLVGYDGALIHADDAPVLRHVRYCADQSAPSVDPMVDDALDDIAARLRFALAPQQRVDDIRILESRSGMAKEDSNAFRDAIRMTKRDEALACDAFAALEPRVGDHVSLMFNLGLCAEARGDFDTATAYYRRAIVADPGKSHPGEGIERIGQRIRAEQQLELRYGP